MRENKESKERWMELCEQAANEQDSQKLMALIKEITALLEAKEERLKNIERQQVGQHLSDAKGAGATNY
jgi:RNA polymerase-binding transcription factor DksA